MSLDRTESVRILLASKLNWTPPLKVASTYADIGGPAPGDRVRCARCRHSGRVIGHDEHAQPCATCAAAHRRALETGAAYIPGCSRCRPCLLCDGTGWRTLVPSEYDDDGEIVHTGRQPYFPGETGEDEYLRPGKNELHEDALTKSETRRRTDALIAALDEQAANREGRVDDLRPYGWERDRDAHYHAGSYAELDRLLERLRDELYVVYWAVVTIYMYEPHHGLRRLFGSSAVEASAQVGLEWLEARMPERIRVPAWLLPERDAAARKESQWRGRRDVHAAQREERDEQIRGLRARLTVDELCTRFALGRSQVYAILAEGQAIASGPAA